MSCKVPRLEIPPNIEQFVFDLIGGFEAEIEANLLEDAALLKLSWIALCILARLGSCILAQSIDLDAH